MSIQSVYRSIPVYLAVPLALLASTVVALALAVVGVVAVGFLLEGLRGRADLGDALFAFFYAGPAIAFLGFVSCFSFLINWHHATSWRAPTFAFALGAILLWAWDFGGSGIAWYVPGTIAWLVSCWLLHRNVGAHSEHVIET
jgi:hypothetical protein